MPENSCLYSKTFRNVNTTNQLAFQKDQLQQNRDQLQQLTLLGIRVFCIDFTSIGRVLSINTGEMFPPGGKAQIREGGKSENITNEQVMRNFSYDHEENYWKHWRRT